MSDQVQLARDIDAADAIGMIRPLRPKVVARAERVVRRFADPAEADQFLDMLGLTEETS